MVRRQGLLYKIYNLGMKGQMYNFIDQFISIRIFFLKVNGYKSKHFILENGIPQGSITSPTLFNIYINYLVHSLKINSKNKLSVGLFADGTAFW